MKEAIVSAIGRAVQVLRDGGIVAYPTDTLYGLAVDPRSPAAVQKLLDLKGRDAGHALPLIAVDLEQAERVAVFDDRARRLAQEFWPGPLSLVLPAKPGLVGNVQAPDGSVAIRVPASEVAQALARGLGFCITATSANVTGDPPTSSPAVLIQTLGDRIDLVLEAGDSPGGAPSTIVDTRASAPRLVRAGAIAWERVLRSIQ